MAALVLALAASAEEGTKQASPPAASEAAKPAPECVAGWELMSDAEIAQHRAAMRAAKTREERERLRAEHRAQMSARAAERGMRLHGEGPCGCGGGPMGAGMSGMGKEMGHTAGAAHGDVP